MAASRDLTIPSRSGDRFGYPVKAGIVLYGRALMAITVLGFAVPAGHADAVAIVGLVEERVDNSAGADGELHATAMRGCFGVVFAADEPDVGRNVYAVDDETFSFDGSGGRLLAGHVAGIGDGRTWIDVAPRVKPAVPLPTRIATLVGAGVTRNVAPVKGRITKLRSVIDGVLTTGDATVTMTINGVAVTNGVLTITQAGSAAGDVDVATPTALNLVNPGDVIGYTVGGTNATATPASVVAEITPS